MKRTNVLCLLLAVAGLSFGIGQTVGQDRAEADVKAAYVMKVKDTTVRSKLFWLNLNIYKMCKATVPIPEGSYTNGCSLPTP